MKLKYSYTIDADIPSDWVAEVCVLTYTMKDDIVTVLQEVCKIITEFRNKHSIVETHVNLELYGRVLQLSCMRKLTDTEKQDLKIRQKQEKEDRLKKRKREVKAEAKKLGLLK